MVCMYICMYVFIYVQVHVYMCAYVWGPEDKSGCHYSGDVLLFLLFRRHFSGLEPTKKSRLIC